MGKSSCNCSSFLNKKKSVNSMPLGGMNSRIDLFAVDLADKNLKGVNFAESTFVKADLSGCDPTDAELTQADLSGADLTGSVLRNISGMRSRWRDAYLERRTSPTRTSQAQT